MERTGREDGMCWDWRAVSAHVPTRSAKQVHEKWLNDFMPGESDFLPSIIYYRLSTAAILWSAAIFPFTHGAAETLG